MGSAGWGKRDSEAVTARGRKDERDSNRRGFSFAFVLCTPFFSFFIPLLLFEIQLFSNFCLAVPCPSPFFQSGLLVLLACKRQLCLFTHTKSSFRTAGLVPRFIHYPSVYRCALLPSSGTHSRTQLSYWVRIFQPLCGMLRRG